MTARDARGFEKSQPERMDALASAVPEAAVEVHRVLGPGFFEAVYEQAFALERTLRRMPFVRQPAVAVVYNDHVNVPILLRGVRRVVLGSPTSL